MALLKIDREKCDRDGLCALECPRGIIAMAGEEGFPEIAPGGEPFCLTCGHCVAVCPERALSLAPVPVEVCPEINEELAITPEQAEQFLRSRRSVRVYKPVEVEREVMETLIEEARYAPSATNAQLVFWTVISGREKLTNLSALTVEWMIEHAAAQPDSLYARYFAPIIEGWKSGYDGVLRSAHTLVVASAPKASNNGLVDCTIALTHLELAALSHGLGTCWAGLLQAGILNSPMVREAVGLPEDHTWHYPMMIGYPKVKYHRLPERKAPKITWK